MPPRPWYESPTCHEASIPRETTPTEHSPPDCQRRSMMPPVSSSGAIRELLLVKVPSWYSSRINSRIPQESHLVGHPWGTKPVGFLPWVLRARLSPSNSRFSPFLAGEKGHAAKRACPQRWSSTSSLCLPQRSRTCLSSSHVLCLLPFGLPACTRSARRIRLRPPRENPARNHHRWTDQVMRSLSHTLARSASVCASTLAVKEEYRTPSIVIVSLA
jgi:hypothetical protein